MDTMFYSRIAMAGWVFTAVILTSLWASNDSVPYWAQLMSLITKSNGTVAIAVFGAVMGVGAPPAIGFLLDRLVSAVFGGIGLSMWSYRCKERFKDILVGALGEDKPTPFPECSGALMCLFFHSFAEPRLAEYARRRRTQEYSALTSGLAILLALLLVCHLRAFDIRVGVVAIVLAAALFVYAYREGRTHKRVIYAWVDLMAPALCEDFASKLAARGKPRAGKRVSE